MKKTLKMLTYIIIFLTISLPAFLFINPHFGSNPTKLQKQFYENLSNYQNGEFANSETFEMMTGEMSMYEFFKSDSNRKPKESLKHRNLDLKQFANENSEKIKLSWLGHSAFLLNINGKIILLDPMLGQYASPVPLPSLKRYSKELGFSIDEFETIDAVVFSHDHYDHLDYSTIKKIKNKVTHFYVPHGLGNHLNKWGIEQDKITELNWNEKILMDDIEFVCLPALHFSGRGPFNRNSTLWSSWAIKSPYGKIYFSGDSGYGTHLKKIGDNHGPFDIALIDCGQYNDAWKFSHMVPEEAVQASQDLRSKYFMPIHWGGFTLSTHAWTEPVERALSFANSVNQKTITPELGQILYLDQEIEKRTSRWWDDLK